ncbi:MAG: alanine racemase [Heliobacteriaceae bacterium]|jgi:alanine racemase|nr:alanine racemase [Heliobacteriaceae bacterium]
MKNIRQSHVNIHRDSWVEINLEAAAHNVKEICRVLPAKTKLLAVVKADAYGHGAVMLAPTLLASGVDMLGVASIDEGVDLREAKINSEILVLGAVPVWAVESAVSADLTISVFSVEHLNACRRAYERLGIKPKVHVKIDTGMNRIGILPDDAVGFIKEVQNADFVELRGIFTHLANAQDRVKTQIQIKKWDEIISRIDTAGLLLHAANSAGLLCYDIAHTNMVRAGISVYGLLPDLPPDCACKTLNLRQVLSLKGRIVHIHEVPVNEGVSYGHTFTAKRTIKAATVPIGYADGVRRELSNRISGMLNGREVPQIGNITMDQMMFDITGEGAQEGDIITLSDENNSIDNWAKILDTINYTLTCSLKVRLPRVYTRQE